MNKKILVADDSPTIRKLAESLLKKQGYEVLCAKDGADALGMAKTNKPDLIFWDASLPILDGQHVCEELKGNEELKDTPLIILLTKDQAEKEEEELKQIGANGFMVKPLNPKDILEKVQEFLNRENTNFKDKMQKGPRDELVCAEEKSSIDKTERSSTLSKKEEKTDESLDIIETSEFVESLEAPPGGSDATEQHGFDWFMSELKKEMEETEQRDLGVEEKSFDREDLKKKDKKEDKIYQIDEDQKGYEDFLSELKRELKEPEVEESLDQKIPPINYDKMIQDLIERISTRIAQEVVKRIDVEILKQMVRDEVDKLRKEGIKTN